MIWLNLEDLKTIGISRGILHRNRSSWKWRDSGVRGRNGKMIQEVLLESLPNEFQLEWARLQLPSDPASIDDTSDENFDSSPEADNALQPDAMLAAALQRFEPQVRQAFLNEAQRLFEIVGRYELINPKRTKTADGKFEFVPAVFSLCREAVCSDPVVLSIEPKRRKEPSPLTLDGWWRKSKVGGLLAFVRSAGSTPVGNADDRRRAKISAPAVEWINDHWRSFASPRHLYKALKKKALKENWSIPAEGWVRRKYKSLPKIVQTVVYKGEKAYTSRFAPYVPRDYRDLQALQILCGDHSVRDVTVMLSTGEVTRPWLTTWQDMRTGLIWGWHLGLTPSSNTIALAYANGVQNFGAQPISNPDAGFYSYLYTDQGKDYKCKTFAGQTLTFKQAALVDGGLKALCIQRKVGFLEEMGLKQILARGYNAREKPVERYHRDISDWEQNYFEDAYCGRDAKNKPDAWVRSWQRHEKLLKKFKGNLEILADETPFVTLDDYRENLAGFINEYNHSEHIRATLGGSKVVPIEEFNRLYTTKYEIAPEALALFAMKADRRKIGKNGIQMFQAHWYFLNEAMSIFKGEEVEVRYSDGDYSRIWAVLPDGKIVEAELVTPSSVLNPNKKTMEAVKRQQAHERNVVRDFVFIQQSKFRGETAEDRVAHLINPEDPEPEAQRIAVNERPVVHNLTRFDRPKLSGPHTAPGVSAEQVERAEVIEGIFRPEQKRTIKEEWED
jgi:hypothetical protein